MIDEKFQNAFRILGFDQNDLMLSEKCKIYFDILVKNLILKYKINILG